jgi:hypothetical protein
VQSGCREAEDRSLRSSAAAYRQKAWAAFPYSDYDFVVLDSISASTEGIEEKDDGKAGAGLAPLRAVSRRCVRVE